MSFISDKDFDEQFDDLSDSDIFQSFNNNPPPPDPQQQQKQHRLQPSPQRQLRTSSAKNRNDHPKQLSPQTTSSSSDTSVTLAAIPSGNVTSSDRNKQLENEIERLKNQLRQAEDDRNMARGKVTILETNLARASIDHKTRLDKLVHENEVQRVAHQSTVQQLKHEVEVVQNEKVLMQNDLTSLQARVRALSQNVAANINSPVNQQQRGPGAATGQGPGTSGPPMGHQEVLMTQGSPLAAAYERRRGRGAGGGDLAPSFRDGFANIHGGGAASPKKRRTAQNLPDKAIELRNLMSEGQQLQDNQPEQEPLGPLQPPPILQHKKLKAQQQPQLPKKLDTPPPAITVKLEAQKTEIDGLRNKVVENTTLGDAKDRIVAYIEMLLTHTVYGNFTSSWDLLSKWSMKVDSNVLPISRILQAALFLDDSGASLSPTLAQIVDGFLERCKTVIFKCIDDNRYGPIPIIFQLISSTINYFPDAILFEHSLASFICSFIETHTPYLKSLPNSDKISKWTYDPFKLPDSSYLHTVNMDSQIYPNDAFKEISIIYSLDLLENVSTRAGALSSDAYKAVWGSVPYNTISLLLSNKITSNILLKVVLALLSSVSDSTIGPIRREVLSNNARVAEEAAAAALTSATASTADKRGTTPGLSRSTTPSSNLFDRSSTPQERNERDLISSLSALLVDDINARHVLLFAGLENLSFTKQNPSLLSHSFTYIYYNDIHSLGKTAASTFTTSSGGSNSQQISISFSAPFTFATLYKSTEQYYHELAGLNTATTLVLRRAVIKFFLLCALTKSPTVIAHSRHAMVAIVQCMARHLDTVYQSVEPDPGAVALIADCVTLLHSLWDLLMPPPLALPSVSAPPMGTGMADSQFSEAHPLTKILATLPYGVSYELVIAMSRIGFSGEGTTGSDENMHEAGNDKDDNPRNFVPPLFSPAIVDMARQVLEYNITSDEADFICMQLSNI